MATKKNAARKAPAKKAPATAPELVELPVSTAIEVSFDGDGKPRVDIDPAMIVPGGEITWHTPPGERRAFTIRLEPGAKLTQAMRKAAERAARSATKSPPLPEGRALKSRPQQIVSVRVPPAFQAQRWNCVIDANGIHITTGVLILGTNVIVRPPKKKIDGHDDDEGNG